MSPVKHEHTVPQELGSRMRQIDVCNNPIFIIGSPRSGTSILAWSLAEHTHLWTSEESDLLLHLYGRGRADEAFVETIAPPTMNWVRAQGVDRNEFLRYLGIGINALFTSRSEGMRWIDQTPGYTLMVDVMADLFPDALFIHILRDGRRVVNSMINFLNPLGEDLRAQRIASGHVPPWANHFKDACEAWRQYVNTAMDFCQRNPSRCLTVVNERLVDDPEQGFTKILAFLGVPQEEGPARYFRSHRINSSFVEGAGIGPSIGLRPDPWRQFSLEQKSIFLEEAGGTLVASGLTSQKEVDLMAAEVEASMREVFVQVQDVANDTLPGSATVLVVSRGDDRLCNLNGRDAWHFPRAADGRYGGYYPSNSDEAIGHLEVLRTKGAQFLLLPSTGFWWLDYYRGFTEYLEQHYSVVVDHSACRIYSLGR
jgi:Sulfotransferase family